MKILDQMIMQILELAKPRDYFWRTAKSTIELKIPRASSLTVAVPPPKIVFLELQQLGSMKYKCAHSSVDILSTSLPLDHFSLKPPK